jgi:hypothetical protein
MRPGRAISHRSFFHVASLGLAAAAIGCFHTEPVPANNDGGGSGSGGSNASGGSTGSGSGGSISSGSGGSTGSGGSDVTGSGGTIAGSGGTVGGTGGVPVGPALPLPIIVTTIFDNQGWFGDAAVMTDFKPGATVISQTESTDGPCATRKAGAKGKCLKVVYTPPTDVTLMATDGYVGVFFLTTIKANHPEAMPAVNIGQANWGTEPGVNIAPGATKISFWAASPTAGLMVSFKAGAGDNFQVPATPEALTTSWASYSLPLTGQDYGTSVLGGFAWVVTDTMKPATFYLDGIIWE